METNHRWLSWKQKAIRPERLASELLMFISQVTKRPLPLWAVLFLCSTPVTCPKWKADFGSVIAFFKKNKSYYCMQVNLVWLDLVAAEVNKVSDDHHDPIFISSRLNSKRRTESLSVAQWNWIVEHFMSSAGSGGQSISCILTIIW